MLNKICGALLLLSLVGCGVSVTAPTPQQEFLNFVPLNQANSHSYSMQYIVTEFAGALDNTKYDPSTVTGDLTITQDQNDGSYQVDWKIGKHDFKFQMAQNGDTITELSPDATGLSIPDFGIMDNTLTTLYNSHAH